MIGGRAVTTGWRWWFSIFVTMFCLAAVILTVVEDDALGAACFGMLLGVNSMDLAQRWRRSHV